VAQELKRDKKQLKYKDNLTLLKNNKIAVGETQKKSREREQDRLDSGSKDRRRRPSIANVSQPRSHTEVE
jgi:hypothetical protein